MRTCLKKERKMIERKEGMEGGKEGERDGGRGKGCREEEKEGKRKDRHEKFPL